MLFSAIRLGRFRFGAAGKATALLSFGLMTNLMPLATFAAMIPAIDRSWGLNASEAGWIGGSISPGTPCPFRYRRVPRTSSTPAGFLLAALC
jgi:hypothetical protein